MYCPEEKKNPYFIKLATTFLYYASKIMYRIINAKVIVPDETFPICFRNSNSILKIVANAKKYVANLKICINFGTFCIYSYATIVGLYCAKDFSLSFDILSKFCAILHHEKSQELSKVYICMESSILIELKPKYSFGKWWKWKISLMGIIHKICMSSLSPVNLFVRIHQFS